MTFSFGTMGLMEHVLPLLGFDLVQHNVVQYKYLFHGMMMCMLHRHIGRIVTSNDNDQHLKDLT
jgi:hypothetical protein